MKRNNIKLKAFTLVELVIVITMVMILSMVAVPVYKKHILNAKFSEAYSLLGTILSAQMAYRSEYGCFLGRGGTAPANRSSTDNETVLGVDARNNKYFKTFLINEIYGQGYDPVKYCFTAWTSGSYGRLTLAYDITAGGATFSMTTA